MTSENPVTRSAPASSVAAKAAFTAGVLTVFLTSLLLVAPQRNSAAADTVSAAEFAQAVRQARQQAPYHVYAPTNLPANWRITSVHHRTDSRGVSFWHVGITTPTQHQIEVVRRLEAGGITLEESLALWERGEELVGVCQRWLDGARARLEAASAEGSTDGADQG